jgi:hypothetical protein
MYRKPARGAAGETGNPVVIRSIGREYRVFSSCPSLRRHLAFIAASPDLPEQRLAPVVFKIEPTQSFYRMRLPTGRAIEGSASVVVERLNRFIVGGLLEEALGGVLLHAASVRCGESTAILIGPKASGKTTLTLRLLAEGFAVEGDEHVVLRSNDVLARPRRMRVKEGSLAFVPSLADDIVRSPSAVDPDGNTIYSVDPAIAGRPWRIAPAKVPHFVLIEPNHGGRTVLAPVPFERAFGRLVANAILDGSNKLGAAVLLRRHLLPTRTWRLSLGDHENAVKHLRRLAA